MYSFRLNVYLLLSYYMSIGYLFQYLPWPRLVSALINVLDSERND